MAAVELEQAWPPAEGSRPQAEVEWEQSAAISLKAGMEQGQSVAISIKWKNPEQIFLTTAAWLGRSVLNLICPTTPRSSLNWLEACSLRPMNICKPASDRPE